MIKKHLITTIAWLAVLFCCGFVFADDGTYGDGVIDHGLLGVADMSFAGGDLTADPTEAGWVDNILQITTWEGNDWVQCWGAGPWDTSGEWIVYTSNRFDDEWVKDPYYAEDDFNEIVKVKADGTGFMQLTDNNSCDSHASFVPPNNDKVVFQRRNYDSDDAEIWIMDADGSNPTNLTQNHGGGVTGGCENKPMVSPDGTKIAFHTCAEDLWVMDIDGTNPVSILGNKTLFDIPEGSNLVFTPNGSGGFTVTTLSGENFQWVAEYGQDLDLDDDETTYTTFGAFSFPFAGATYSGDDELYISSNGFINLGGDNDESYDDNDPEALVGDEYACIAPIWTDLDPEEDGAVYLNTPTAEMDTEPDRIVITWDTVYYESEEPVAVQLQLFQDGTIIMGYLDHNWDNDEDNNILLGLSPGGDGADPGATDFSAAVPFDSGNQPTIYELFYSEGDDDANASKHSWSPDSQWIVYGDRDEDTDDSRIFRAEADGSGATKLSDENMVVTFADESTFTAQWKCENWPSISPDGQWIAFHGRYEREIYNGEYSNYEEVSTLNLMPATGSDGDDVIQLVVGSYDLDTGVDWVCGPNSWSPDSKWIAFKVWNDSTETSDVFSINIATREIVQLTQGFRDYRIWWSPDGGKILFRDKEDFRDVRGIIEQPEGSRDDRLFGWDLLVINLKVCDSSGDVDKDGDVDTADLALLYQYLNQEVPDEYPCADLNGDGYITILDIRQMLSENPALSRTRRPRRR